MIDYDCGTWAKQKDVRRGTGLPHILVFFSKLKISSMEKVKISNVRGTMQLILFILAQCVWKNNSFGIILGYTNSSSSMAA